MNDTTQWIINHSTGRTTDPRPQPPTVGDHVTVSHGRREWFVEELTPAGLAVVVLLDGTEAYDATRMTVPLSDLHKIQEG